MMSLGAQQLELHRMDPTVPSIFHRGSQFRSALRELDLVD